MVTNKVIIDYVFNKALIFRARMNIVVGVDPYTFHAELPATFYTKLSSRQDSKQVGDGLATALTQLSFLRVTLLKVIHEVRYDIKVIFSDLKNMFWYWVIFF